MIKIKRVIIMGIICAVIMSFGGLTVFAENRPAKSIGIEPYWINTSTITLQVTATGNLATCSALVAGEDNVTNIISTYWLTKKNADGTFSDIKVWSGINTTGFCQVFEEPVTIPGKGTYRFHIAAVVKASDGTKETVTNFVEKIYS